MSPVPWNGHLAEVTESDTYKTGRVRRKPGLQAPIMHSSRNWHATNGWYSRFSTEFVCRWDGAGWPIILSGRLLA
ncbi:hypothetical protein ACVWYP_002192 [Bradyrhizobium sp. USDA 3262]